MCDLTSKYIFSYINELNDGKMFEELVNKSVTARTIQTTDAADILIFNSKTLPSQKFTIVKKAIVLDEDLVTNLTNLILRQLSLSKIIPTKLGLEEGNYRERTEGHIKSIINNLVFYKWYYDQDNLSVLDMAADIMYRISAINHPFTNGNKRTALFSTGAFLNSVGLYLSFYRLQTKTDYLEQWEEFMIDIAKSREIAKTEAETLTKIKNKLFDSIEINFNENMIFTKTIKKTVSKEVQHEEIEF